MSLFYIKAQNNEIYEITATLLDLYYVLYLCVVVNIIRCEEMISVTIIFLYSQYYQRRTTVVYLKFDCFEGPTLAV